jgi:hypothetical protein
MSMSKVKSNNTYQSEVDKFSYNPWLQQIVAKHLKINGSLQGISSAVHSHSNATTNSYNKYSCSGDNSPKAGSTGKYMVHCYYGCQPGDKITTVIG